MTYPIAASTGRRSSTASAAIGAKKLYFVPLAAEIAPAVAFPPVAFAAAAPIRALIACARVGSSPFRLLISASLRPAPAAPEAKPAPESWLMSPPIAA